MMLHRLKLRLLYKDQIDTDTSVRRNKFRVILVSGFGVYLPFLIIAYFIAFEKRALYLLLIGFLSALSCIPVVWYAYAKGFHAPFLILWKERRAEMIWLAVKIGFLYAFILYWMILGIVEFLFNYSVVRAAMISFVAAATARDGFEIGRLRARSDPQPIFIFPDGQSISHFLKSAPIKQIFFAALSFSTAVGLGLLIKPYLKNPIEESLAIGFLVGGMATTVYLRATAQSLPFWPLVRFFIWPGFTMAITYFLILAYLSRIVFRIPVDFSILMGMSATILMVELRFVGFLKKASLRDTQKPLLMQS